MSESGVIRGGWIRMHYSNLGKPITSAKDQTDTNAVETYFVDSSLFRQPYQGERRTCIFACTVDYIVVSNGQIVFCFDKK